MFITYQYQYGSDRTAWYSRHTRNTCNIGVIDEPVLKQRLNVYLSNANLKVKTRYGKEPYTVKNVLLDLAIIICFDKCHGVNLAFPQEIEPTTEYHGLPLV